MALCCGLLLWSEPERETPASLVAVRTGFDSPLLRCARPCVCPWPSFFHLQEEEVDTPDFPTRFEGRHVLELLEAWGCRILQDLDQAWVEGRLELPKRVDDRLYVGKEFVEVRVFEKLRSCRKGDPGTLAEHLLSCQGGHDGSCHYGMYGGQYQGRTSQGTWGFGKAVFDGNGQAWIDLARGQGNLDGRPISLTVWQGTNVFIDGITW